LAHLGGAFPAELRALSPPRRGARRCRGAPPRAAAGRCRGAGRAASRRPPWPPWALAWRAAPSRPFPSARFDYPARPASSASSRRRQPGIPALCPESTSIRGSPPELSLSDWPERPHRRGPAHARAQPLRAARCGEPRQTALAAASKPLLAVRSAASAQLTVCAECLRDVPGRCGHHGRLSAGLLGEPPRQPRRPRLSETQDPFCQDLWPAGSVKHGWLPWMPLAYSCSDSVGVTNPSTPRRQPLAGRRLA